MMARARPNGRQRKGRDDVSRLCARRRKAGRHFGLPKEVGARPELDGRLGVIRDTRGVGATELRPTRHRGCTNVTGGQQGEQEGVIHDLVLPVAPQRGEFAVSVWFRSFAAISSNDGARTS